MEEGKDTSILGIHSALLQQYVSISWTCMGGCGDRTYIQNLLISRRSKVLISRTVSFMSRAFASARRRPSSKYLSASPKCRVRNKQLEHDFVLYVNAVDI